MSRDTYNDNLDEQLYQLAGVLQTFKEGLGSTDVRALRLIETFQEQAFKMTEAVSAASAPFSSIGRTVVVLIDDSLTATRRGEYLEASPLTIALQTAEAIEGMMLTRGESDVRVASYVYSAAKLGEPDLRRVDPLVVLQLPEVERSRGGAELPLASVFAELPLAAAAPTGATHIILLSAGGSADVAGDAYAIQKLIHSRVNTTVDVVALASAREDALISAVAESVPHRQAQMKPVLALATDTIGALAVVEEIVNKRFNQMPLQQPVAPVRHGCTGIEM